MAVPSASLRESLPVSPDPAARASALMALLGARKLDRTLTSVAPSRPRETLPFLDEAINTRLGGGVPRGEVSEVVGPASSGRTGLAWAALAAATARGEWAALVDTFDRFDPERAAEAGIVLPHLLWVRGQALSKTAGAVDPAWVPGERAVRGPGTLLERTVDRALKALNLIVQSGVCTFAVLDLIDVPASALARVPRSTWLRIHRIIEGSETAVLLLAASPVARSARGMSVVTGVGRKGSVGSRESGTGKREGVGRGEKSVIGSGAALERWQDSALPAPDPRLPTPDSRLPTPDSVLSPSDSVLWRGAHDRSRRLGGVATRVRATSPRGFVGELPLLAD